jgi:hypothetical protein
MLYDPSLIGRTDVRRVFRVLAKAPLGGGTRNDAHCKTRFGCSNRRAQVRPYRSRANQGQDSQYQRRIQGPATRGRRREKLHAARHDVELNVHGGERCPAHQRVQEQVHALSLPSWQQDGAGRCTWGSAVCSRESHEGDGQIDDGALVASGRCGPGWRQGTISDGVMRAAGDGCSFRRRGVAASPMGPGRCNLAAGAVGVDADPQHSLALPRSNRRNRNREPGTLHDPSTRCWETQSPRPPAVLALPLQHSAVRARCLHSSPVRLLIVLLLSRPTHRKASPQTPSARPHSLPVAAPPSPGCQPAE